MKKFMERFIEALAQNPENQLEIIGGNVTGEKR